MLILIAMSETEFNRYQSTAIQDYADEHIRSGKWSAAEGLAEAAKVHQELLPQGLHTKDHYFWSLFLSESQENIGMLWFASVERAGKRIAYVYDFAINPEWRRRGYGEQAFRLMEEKVKSMGLSSIALHVFGHNQGAYALYQKMGYMATNINMSKSLVG